MKLTYVVSYLLTLFGLVTSLDHSDKQLFCETYTLVKCMKDMINSTKMENRMVISALDSRIKNSLSCLKERLDEKELPTVHLKNYTSALQVTYNEIQLALLDMGYDWRGDMAENQTIEGKEDMILKSLQNTIALGPYGGHGGGDFTDEEAALNGNITAVHYSKCSIKKKLCRRLGFSYGDFRVLHGMLVEENINTTILTAGEFIVGMKGCTINDTYGHTVIDGLTFQTNLRNISVVPKKSCNNGVSFGNMPASPPYRKLAYISGKFGYLIDQLTFHFFSTYEDDFK